MSTPTESSTPLLGIGMPVYNSEQWIADSIDSILDQTFSNFELIISDNASTDSTRSIIEHFASNDRRIRYHRNDQNIGVFRNYNLVLRQSRSRYFKWASSNDVCHPSMLAACIDALRENPKAILAYPTTRLFETDISDSRMYNEDFDLDDDDPVTRFRTLCDSMRLSNMFNGVFDSQAIKRVPELKEFFGSDVTLLSELVLQGAFVHAPEAIFYRRMLPESSSILLNKEDNTEVLKKYAPKMKSDLRMNTWRRLLEWTRIILQAPLSLKKKGALLLYIARRARWVRQRLWGEVRDLIGRTPG